MVKSRATSGAAAGPHHAGFLWELILYRPRKVEEFALLIRGRRLSEDEQRVRPDAVEKALKEPEA